MRYGRISAAILIVAGVLIGEWFYLQAKSEPPAIEAEPGLSVQAAALGGPFSLTDHAGAQVSEQAFRGRYLVMVFGYTFCPDVCPTTLSAVAEAMDLLGPTAEKVQPLFVSVDPERDTPAVMADYVAAFHPRMIGLTGSPAQIKEIAQSYRVYYSKVETGDGFYPLDHSAYIYVLGPDGAILTYLKHDATPQLIATAIQSVMARAAASAARSGDSARRPKS